MSDGLNVVHLFGNLGADPELKQTAGGPMLRMRLATSYTYVDKEKKTQAKTEWHSVKVWGPRAEGLAKILTKGSRAHVTGHLETSSYEKNGEKRYHTDVIATRVLLAGGPRVNARDESDLATRDADFPLRDADIASRDPDLASRDPDVRSRDGGFGSRDRDFGSRAAGELASSELPF
jgi:single-strand DNA-binding protein